MAGGRFRQAEVAEKRASGAFGLPQGMAICGSDDLPWRLLASYTLSSAER